jgi:amidophosphoribosyltransferase
MCGIVGVFLGNGSTAAATEILEGLCQLQHRGQDACGVATAGNSSSYCIKGKGLLSDVFGSSISVKILPGHIGLGHCEWQISLTVIAD